MNDKETDKVSFGKSDGFRRFKLSLKRLTGREPRLSIDLRIPLENFGVWQVCPDLFPPGGVVYSLGVGEDIDFDLAMIQAKNMQVHAFDPTPNSVDWLEQQEMLAGFHFHPWAVADTDGTFFLYPRLLRDGTPSTTMFTLLAESNDREGAVEIPAKAIADLRSAGYALTDILSTGREYTFVLRSALKNSATQ